MKHLTAQQTAELKALLEHRAEELAQFKESVQEANPINDPERLLDNSDMGDEALEDHSILENDVLTGQSASMLKEITAALQRLEDGTYGLDEETGQPIPYERLRLVPEARHAAPKK